MVNNFTAPHICTRTQLSCVCPVGWMGTQAHTMSTHKSHTLAQSAHNVSCRFVSCRRVCIIGRATRALRKHTIKLTRTPTFCAWPALNKSTVRRHCCNEWRNIRAGHRTERSHPRYVSRMRRTKERLLYSSSGRRALDVVAILRHRTRVRR